jgi:hypothetical protein
MAIRKQIADELIYHIRVKGYLEEKWADWFDSFVMTSRVPGETLLSGPVVDQSALHGVLAKLHGLGLTTLLVVQAECPCTKSSCPRRSQCSQCAAYHGAKGKLPYCFRPGTRWDKQCTFLKINR